MFGRFWKTSEWTWELPLLTMMQRCNQRANTCAAAQDAPFPSSDPPWSKPLEVEPWGRKDEFLFPSKIEWDRLPTDLTFSKLLYRVIRYSGFLAVREKWVRPLEISWIVGRLHPMTDPWEERYIYLREWLIFMEHVGKYTMHGCYGYSYTWNLCQLC